MSPLKERFNISVYLDNYVNAVAIGEFMFGAGKGDAVTKEVQVIFMILL